MLCRLTALFATVLVRATSSAVFLVRASAMVLPSFLTNCFRFV